MPTFLESRNSVRQAIGRTSGKMLQGRTYAVTSGTPALVRAEDLLLRTDDFGRGLELYVASGNGSGQARTIVSTAAFVQGTGSIVYPHVDFNPAPSTNSAIELWRGIQAQTVNGFIDDAIRNASRRYLQHKEDYSIQLGDPLRHWGSFERWPDGNSNTPDGWNEDSGDGTVAREATLVYSGRYSLTQVNTDANAYILESDDIPNLANFAGEIVSVKAKLNVTTNGRVRINLVDGSNTFSSGFHSGTGGWNGKDADNPIAIENVTIASNPSELRVQLEIQTGGVVTATWGKIWMEHDGQVYDFELPADIDPATAAEETAFATISEVWAESTITPGEFNTLIPAEFYRIDRDSATRRIIFTKGVIDQFSSPGRQVKIIGQRPARLPTADTQNLEVDPEYVRLQALYSLFDAMAWDDMDRSKRDRFERLATAKLADITTGVYPDSVVVEL